MAEAVFDPLGRRWVLLAPERAHRGTPPLPPLDRDPAPCDFCEGQEQNTPPETFAIRKHGTAPDTPGWRVRVVPNLYPATRVHEVVVHSPHHEGRFETLDHGRRRAVVLTYRSRLSAIDVTCPVVVWNRGRAAGATRSHPHGQLFGLDLVPPTIEREVGTFGAGDCVLCELASRDELRVATLDHSVVLAHPAPLVGHELLVIPRCQPSITDVATEELGEIAEAWAAGVEALKRGIGDTVSFNLVLHTAPAGVERFHWHVHLLPRVGLWGGLEMGAELPIVAADPQDTARKLRAD